jgi:hypothetical protein
MPAIDPQTRFLLRGSALLIGLLTLWWFVLLGPMSSLLHEAAGGFLLIQENPAGDWTLRVPLEMTLPATPQRQAQQISSIDFDLARKDIVSFTFSLPLFWAVVLAAPGLRRGLRPLLLGTVLMSVVELLLLLAFVQIGARNAAAQYAGSQDEVGRWFRRAAEYLVVNVLPSAVPFVVALSLHRGLREAIFPLKEAGNLDVERTGSPRRHKDTKKTKRKQ